MTQKEALDILKLGHNVFLTGPAGSGKTYLLNQYIAYLKSHSISVGITASTGIAATHMGGTTIHSWSGIGIRDQLDEQGIAEIKKKGYLYKHFAKTKVLIIDEISMLHAGQLDMVDAVCRAFKNNSSPFGGMQVIMCGDFFQLPPVTKKPQQVIEANPQSKNQSTMEGIATSSPQNEVVRNDILTSFVTASKIWNEMQLQICYLEEQYRQDDRTFLRVLNDIRNGEVDEMTVEYLSERLNKPVEGYAKPTRLFTHNTDVDAINKTHLDALPGEAHSYYMSWRGSLGLTQVLRKSCLAPEVLTLKIGAQVMFVKNNYEAGYFNGTVGEVIKFTEEGEPIVRTFDGDEITVKQASWGVNEENIEIAAISQLPLRLAWAITVHKSQGMSLDAAEIDLSRAFVPGMGYVALSRVRNLRGLKLMGMNQMALLVNPDVAEMDTAFHERSQEAIEYLSNLSLEKKQDIQQEFLQYLQES